MGTGHSGSRCHGSLRTLHVARVHADQGMGVGGQGAGGRGEERGGGLGKKRRGWRKACAPQKQTEAMPACPGLSHRILLVRVFAAAGK